MTTLQIEALACRIHGIAKPARWGLTVEDIAEALRETPARVRAVCRRKGWLDRLEPSEDTAGHEPDLDFSESA